MFLQLPDGRGKRCGWKSRVTSGILSIYNIVDKRSKRGNGCGQMREWEGDADGVETKREKGRGEEKELRFKKSA